MTDRPPDRPDFEPPEGQPPWPDGSPADEAPVPPAEPLPPAAWQAAPQAWVPPPPPPQPPPPPPPPPPVQHHDVLPPGPYKQPWVPPRPRRRPRQEPGHGSIVLGMLVSLAALGLAFQTLGAAVFIVALGLFVVGIVLSAMPKTSRTGAGLLIGLGASVLIAAGICIALIATYPV